MPKNKNLILMALIIIFALALRLIFFVGVYGSDDLGYYEFAYKAANNELGHEENFHSTRIGLIYPTALSYRLFGVNKYTSNLLPLITSMLSIILAYQLGKLLFSDKAGIMAAFLLSFYPVHVLYSSMLFPDLPSAYFVALGTFLFLKADKTGTRLNYLLSGASIGIAYLMKELSVLIFLFFGIYILYKRKFKLEYSLLALGFLLVFSFEAAYYASQGYSPLFRYTRVESQASAIMKYYYPNYMSQTFSRWFLHYPYVLLSDSEAAFFYASFFVSIGYFLINRKKAANILLIWVIPIFLFLNFGSNSFSEYIPLAAGVRYLEILTLPCIMLLASLLLQKNIPAKKILVPGAISVLLLASFYSLHTSEKISQIMNVKETKNYLESKPSKLIYADTRTSEILKYLFGYARNDLIVPFNQYDVANFAKGDKNTLLDMRNIHDSYIIVDRVMLSRLSDHYNDMKFPKEIHEPPKSCIAEKEYGKGNTCPLSTSIDSRMVS